jgi:hypothetical protein
MLPRIPETRATHLGAGIPPVPAVRPVGSVDPALSSALGELARAGIDLATLLEGGADSLVVRELPTATALGDVLERARAAVVRGLPSDALAILDDGWEGASRTEGGWYYRAAALMLLGLPGESDRVLSQALIGRGGSVALHFLHSVVRDFQSDSAGARESLANALARLPGHTLLVSWQAVLLARTGDRSGAQALLAPLLEADPESSVLAWARKAVTAAGAQHVRTASRSHHVEMDTPDDMSVRPGWAATATSAAPVDVALRKVGAQLVAGTAHEVRLEVRAMLQGLAPGGRLDGTVRPEQALSVRSALVAVLGVLAREEPGAVPRAASPLEATADARGRWAFTPSSARPSVRTDALPPSSGPRALLLHAMRAGDLAAATSLLADTGAKEGEAVASVLRTMLEGAEAPVGQTVRAGVVQERLDDQLLVPIRVGLSLLQEASARDEARATIAATQSGARDTSASAPRADSFATAPDSARDARELPLGVALGAVLPPVSQPTVTGSPHGHRDVVDDIPHGNVATQIPSMAILCMALAFAALLAGYGIVSIALAGGASWLALRSSIAASRGRRQPIEQVTSEPERR